MKIEVNTVKPSLTLNVNDLSYRLIDFSYESILDSSIKKIEDYITETNGVNKTEEEKDGLYSHAQLLWKEFQNELTNSKFNFHLNREQFKLLTDILLKKLDYDKDTLFIAIELTDLLGGMNGTKYNNENEVQCFQVTPTEITYIYHLIQGFKIKGLTRDAYTFSKILLRIADISKIVSYYDTYLKRLTEEISKWALSLDKIEDSLEIDGEKMTVTSKEVKNIKI